MQAIPMPVSNDNNVFTTSENIFFSSSVSKVSLSNYVEHDPISIDGNDDFINQATLKGWPGDGSEVNPYVIDSLAVSDYSGKLISISNTDLYFQIRNCLIIDGVVSISLNNAMNGYIFNNTVFDTIGGGNERWGVLLTESDNNFISNNTFYNLEFALQLDSSSDENTLTGNVLYDNINPIMISGTYNRITNNSIFNNDMGVTIFNSMFITFSFNWVKNNGGYGVVLQSCDNSILNQNSIEGNNVGFFLGNSHANSFFKNSINNNNGGGFYIADSNNNILISNNVNNNGAPGVGLVNSNGHTISSNIVSQNNLGILFEGSSSLNNVTSNTITNNIGGMQILSGSDNNIIKFNNLMNNAFSGSAQASDYGSNNIFNFNYWDDWTSPDNDDDGIVDTPYHIDGGGQDFYPLTSPIHYLTTPTILSSFEGDTLKGMVTIQWSSSTDSIGQNVIYSVYYSPDNGSTWIQVASGLTTTSYAWNTNNVPDGTNYKIKVVATTPDGLASENILEETFSVHNVPPDFSFLIIGLAFIPIIPELYLSRRLNKALSRKSEEGVEHT